MGREIHVDLVDVLATLLVNAITCTLPRFKTAEHVDGKDLFSVLSSLSSYYHMLLLLLIM